MATILSKDQCARINKVRKEIAGLDIQDWICEGADDLCNAFFNNNIDDGYFIADYMGNIVANPYGITITPELHKLARLEGEISRIALEDIHFQSAIQEEDVER